MDPHSHQKKTKKNWLAGTHTRSKLSVGHEAASEQRSYLGLESGGYVDVLSRPVVLRLFGRYKASEFVVIAVCTQPQACLRC